MSFIRLFIMGLAFSTLIPPASAALYEIPLKNIDGKTASLAAYKGKVILIVNVASECGFTPQYKSLEAAYRKYQKEGFVIAGFPSNDFGGQEPGSNEEIKAFCAKKFDVTFPLFDKVAVKGEKQHPLYAALTGPQAAFPGDVQWNFGKFLVGRDGKVIARFEPDEAPDSEKVTKAIEAALKAK